MKTRNINLDALRVFAIIGVITLHLAGGVNTLQLGAGNKIIVIILLAITYTSVNIFGLLSGYLKIDKPHHNASIIKIILQTSFWCFIIAISCAKFANQKSLRSIIINSFPFIGDRLWYITCYFFLFLFIPYLNLLVSNLPKSSYLKMLIICAVLMSLITTICLRDLFHVVHYGYSAAWLIFLYMLGGYLKIYGFSKKITKKKAIIILCISTNVIIFSKIMLDMLLIKAGLDTDRSWLLFYYSSPLTLLNSICIFYIFVNGNLKENRFGKLLHWLSSVSLGIYIIHAHPYSLDYVLTSKNLTWVVKENPILTLLLIIGIVICILFGLGTIEWIRMKVFNYCNIDKWINAIGAKADKYLAVDYNKDGQPRYSTYRK